MTDRAAGKASARAEARAARAAAQAAAPGAARMAAGHALEVVAGMRGVAVVAGYLPVRGELDSMPAMLALLGLGYRLAVPVIAATAMPLVFRAWTPAAALERGPLGVPVPVEGETVEPDLLLVPLLAFDRRCHRLGYGGGYYDRTIAGLRAVPHSGRPVTAFGLAFAAQEIPEVPDSAHDMQLDAVVTEAGVVRPEVA